MNAKPLNSPVLSFTEKSMLHVSCKQDVEFKPKNLQLSCLAISSGKFPKYKFFIVMIGAWNGMRYFLYFIDIAQYCLIQCLPPAKVDYLQKYFLWWKGEKNLNVVEF